MDRWFFFSVSILVLLLGATLSLAVDPLPRPGPTSPTPGGPLEPPVLLSKEVAQRLRTTIPRAMVVNSLMSGPATKSALTAEATKRGFTSTQLANMGSIPISRIGIKPISIMTPEQAADAALLNLNWDAGLTFTPFNVPRYGSGNWNVGALTIKYAYLATYFNEYIKMENYQSYTMPFILLRVELPMNQPAIYAVTIRLVRTAGQSAHCVSSPTWLTDNLLRAYYYDDWIIGAPQHAIPLTMLSDKTGFVGVISVNPTASGGGSDYGMRKCTINIYFVFSNTNYDIANVTFSGITITRL